ncbi:MAG: cytidine/deoxycytidylate deaminase family protein [Candidatus Saganbacteria bacterium]|nr:cytidine/deoxycytidylate deaminase family protein [Candidatus Saganbacteria bacterium]
MDKKEHHRPSWDEYFVGITKLVGERSTCLKRTVGAIIVKDNRILTTGYNGAPKGLDHCVEVGCIRKEMNVPSGQRHELCRGLHAEQNAIIQAAWHGVKIEGATMYSTYKPCVICVKMIINAGIKKLVYVGSYPDELASKMLLASGLEVVNYKEEA